MLCGCPIVAKTAISTRGAARMADVAIRFWDLMARSPEAVSAFRRGGHGSIRGRGSLVGMIEPRRLIITTLSFLSGCKTCFRSQLGSTDRDCFVALPLLREKRK
jgi:hypothetical protein